MRAIKKKLLLATLAIAVTAQPYGGNKTVYAADDDEEESTSSVSNNEVTIDEGTHDIIYGGGTESNNADSFGNIVAVNGGSLNGVFGGISISGNVYNNRVVINGGTINGGISGGLTYFPYDSNATAGNVYGNTIIVNGGQIGYVSGGEVAYTYDSSGGSTLDFSAARFLNGGNVYSNTVAVNGGEILYGISGGSALTGSALNNTISIYGGTVSGNIIAGEVRNPTANSAVTGNTINIGNPNNPNAYINLSGATLIGGMLGSSYSPAGNTLNIYSSSVTARNINGFEGVNFFVPNSALADTSSPILTLTNGSTSLELDSIGVQVPGNSNFNDGDKINLIYNSNGLTSSASSYETTVTKGVTEIYGLTLTNDSTGLNGTISSKIGNTPNVENIAKTPVTPILVVRPVLNVPDRNSVGNFVTDSDGYFLDSEDSKAQIVEDARLNPHFETFLNAGYGHIKTKTGGDTYVTANSQNYDLGLSKTFTTTSSNISVAPVIEYNRGTYDSKLKNGTTGNGKTRYIAGGFVVRNMNNSGFYYEGSFRGGKAKNEFTANNFWVNESPQRVSYDMDAPLFTGHIRLGKFNRLDRNNVLEVYGIYSYSKQNGMSTNLSSGEHVNFGSVHNSLERIGYRLTTRTSRISQVYTGLAFQHESGSGSTASGNGWSSSSSGISGSSGMLEIGWLIRPQRSVPWAVNIYSTGWLGHQRGLTAMAKVQKSF